MHTFTKCTAVVYNIYRSLKSWNLKLQSLLGVVYVRDCTVNIVCFSAEWQVLSFEGDQLIINVANK